MRGRALRSEWREEESEDGETEDDESGVRARRGHRYCGRRKTMPGNSAVLPLLSASPLSALRCAVLPGVHSSRSLHCTTAMAGREALRAPSLGEQGERTEAEAPPPPLPALNPRFVPVPHSPLPAPVPSFPPFDRPAAGAALWDRAAACDAPATSINPSFCPRPASFLTPTTTLSVAESTDRLGHTEPRYDCRIALCCGACRTVRLCRASDPRRIPSRVLPLSTAAALPYLVPSLLATFDPSVRSVILRSAVSSGRMIREEGGSGSQAETEEGRTYCRE